MLRIVAFWASDPGLLDEIPGLTWRSGDFGYGWTDGARVDSGCRGISYLELGVQ
jgi:hypothetical protein